SRRSRRTCRRRSCDARGPAPWRAATTTRTARPRTGFALREKYAVSPFRSFSLHLTRVVQQTREGGVVLIDATTPRKWVADRAAPRRGRQAGGFRQSSMP